MYNKNLIITFIILFFIYQIQPVQAMEGGAGGEKEKEENRKRTRREEEEKEEEEDEEESYKRYKKEREERHRDERRREERHRDERRREERHRDERRREERHRDERRREERHRDERRREERHRRRGENLTKDAEDDERTIGRYTSPEGLIYERDKATLRVLHIKRHLEKLPRKGHSYFLEVSDIHNDIVRFIDDIFGKIKGLPEYNQVVQSTQNKTDIKYSDIGDITLNNKQYSVLYTYHNGAEQVFFNIIPKDEKSNYPVIGRNKDGKIFYGYMLKLDATLTNIQTFHPLELE